MLQGALVRIAAYSQVLILVHKASVEATIRRRPPKRRRQEDLQAQGLRRGAGICRRKASAEATGSPGTRPQKK